MVAIRLVNLGNQRILTSILLLVITNQSTLSLQPLMALVPQIAPNTKMRTQVLTTTSHP